MVLFSFTCAHVNTRIIKHLKEASEFCRNIYTRYHFCKTKHTDLYLQLLCWQLSEGGGDAATVWAA